MAETATSRAPDQDGVPLAADVREAARLEGFRQGLAEARAEAAERGARMDTLMARLCAPFEAIEEQIEQELLALVKALTRQLVRREMRSDPSQVIGVIREAVRSLPVAAMNLKVRLHPDDAAVVRECLAGEEGARPWQLQEDPAMARGGCVVTSDNTRVDATLETRLGRLVAEMLGSERSGDG